MRHAATLPMCPIQNCDEHSPYGRCPHPPARYQAEHRLAVAEFCARRVADGLPDRSHTLPDLPLRPRLSLFLRSFAGRRQDRSASSSGEALHQSDIHDGLAL
jgi:hypothetical protein